MKIDLSKYFDKVYILTYVGCHKDKLPNIKKQFEDLFVNEFDSNFINVKYSFNSSLFRDLYTYYLAKNTNLEYLDDHSLNITIWHYLIVKEAYELGYKHILIIEDDINFLKNTNYIANVLNSLPENYDICQLHKGFVYMNSIDLKVNKHNDYYLNYNNQIDSNFYDYIIPVSSACNCFSNNGMKKFLDIFENLETCISHIPLVCDTYYVKLKDINYYICLADLCICGNKENNDYENCIINNYKESDYFYE